MAGLGGFTDSTAVAPSADSTWIKVTASLTPSQTKVIDITPVTGFTGASYIIALWNTSEEVTRLLHLDIAKKNSITVKDTIHAKIGDVIKMDISPSISGSDLEISMTNNETFTVQVELRRLLLGTP